MPASAKLRSLVVERAGNRCEYCTIHQDEDRMLRFPVDRVIAGQHGGQYTPDNTVLACPHCNRKKGPNIASVVPGTSNPIALFNPRTEVWAQHFTFHGPIIVGSTVTGEATVALLDMNADVRVALRKLREIGAKLLLE
jgi:hypothetical protein